MADQSLQAFQLGASLFDRAQTQKRMMEQMKLQTAESLLQQRGMQLQNQIRDITLADALGEQEAQVAEFQQFSDLSKQVGDYLDNPTKNAKFPVVPAFKSKQYRIEADKMLNNLEKYSARAELLKAQDKARTDSITKQTAILREAMNIPGAVDIDPQTETPTINWPVYNAGKKQLFESQVQKTQAQTTSILGNLNVAKGNLQRLISEGASDAAIQNAKLEYQKLKDAARLELDRDEFGLKKTTQEAKTKLEGEKFDFTKGVQLKKLELQELDLGQRVKRTDAYVQNLLKPVAEKNIKLNVFDDSLVRKTASFVANQQSAADAIEKTMEILDDPNVDESVKIRTAQLLAKDLNDPKGRDAVGNQEADRILGELDIISFSRAWDKGNISDFLGRDLSGFREKLGIAKSGLDSKISKSIDRVNSIYKKYEGSAAGTSQAPSKNTLITAGATKPSVGTNAPVSMPSFRTIQEAKAAGVQPGTRVIINGVQGTIK